MTAKFSISAPPPRHHRSCLRWLGLAFMVVAMTASAQNPNGALRGEVQDQSGARVSSAQVVLMSSGSSARREAPVNERGEFRIEGLLPGPYHVTVSAKGFADAASEVDVVVSFVRALTVTLKPSAGRETLNVSGTASSTTT